LHSFDRSPFYSNLATMLYPNLSMSRQVLIAVFFLSNLVVMAQVDLDTLIKTELYLFEKVRYYKPFPRIMILEKK
jgi:hypothetical protein